MKKNLIDKIKNIAGWTGFGVFIFWAVCLLAAGNPLSAILTAAFAFFVSPLRRKTFEKWNITLAGKKLVWISGFLFLSSCGTFVGLTEVEDTTNNTETQMAAVVEEADLKVLESTETAASENILKQEKIQEDVIDAQTEPSSEKESEVEKTTEKGVTAVEATKKGAADTVAVIDQKESIDFIDIEKDNEEPVISKMLVHFIDVGQGDATLITCEDEAMLIDAGDNSKGTTVQLYLKKQGIKKLKYFVLTHPDADHIGGADVVVSKFDIENVFMSDYAKDNKTYDELIRALDNKNLKWTTPNVGNSYSLGSAEFTIIAPNTTYSDPNNSSIGLVLRNGEDSFLFTGDAEEEAEYDILANGLDIDCDVYKAGHHGSKTASTQELLEAATPECVVISCAEENSYGHPHAGPMNSFRSMGAKLFRTDEQGSIIATSDGAEITWNCAPSESWKAGESTQASAPAVEQASTSVAEQAPASVVEQTPAPVAEQAPASVAEQTPTSVAEQTPAPVITETPPTVETPPTDPNAGMLVWKSATGEKYHSINDCGRMNPDKATQMTKAEAEAIGLGQCSKCW